jgi:hypothetical protein
MDRYRPNISHDGHKEQWSKVNSSICRAKLMRDQGCDYTLIEEDLMTTWGVWTADIPKWGLASLLRITA